MSLCEAKSTATAQPANEATGGPIRCSGLSLPRYTWKRGQIIIRMICGGSEQDRNEVQANARKWWDGPKGINLTLKFIYPHPTMEVDIQVILTDRGVSWSYVGTAARLIEGATMELGILGEGDLEVRRYNTQHEFGHAIGPGHEHQSPLCTIKRVPQQQIYSHYSSLCKWSTEKIEKEIIRRYPLSEVRVTSYDERSVMHYPIDPILTTNRKEIKRNIISDIDWDTQPTYILFQKMVLIARCRSRAQYICL